MQQTSRRFGPVLLLPLILALLVIVAHRFLPFINQPTLGPSTIPVLEAARSNNEFGLSTNGLILIPIVAGLLFFLGLWTLSNPQISRAAAYLTALAGVLLLVLCRFFYGLCQRRWYLFKLNGAWFLVAPESWRCHAHAACLAATCN